MQLFSYISLSWITRCCRCRPWSHSPMSVTSGYPTSSIEWYCSVSVKKSDVNFHRRCRCRRPRRGRDHAMSMSESFIRNDLMCMTSAIVLKVDHRGGEVTSWCRLIIWSVMGVVMMGVIGGALSEDLGGVRDGVGDCYDPTILCRCTTNPSTCRWGRKKNGFSSWYSLCSLY